jgi:hypothetical protein
MKVKQELSERAAYWKDDPELLGRVQTYTDERPELSAVAVEKLARSLEQWIGELSVVLDRARLMDAEGNFLGPDYLRKVVRMAADLQEELERVGHAALAWEVRHEEGCWPWSATAAG